jgi:rod shape determining protein RodA
MSRFRSTPLGDNMMFWLVIGLAGFGIMMVYSAGVLDVPSNVTPGIWRRQLLWFLIALVLTYFLMRVPVIWLEWAAQPFYAFCLVLLVLALVIGRGQGTAASTSSWIGFGGFQIQPSEFAKIAVIMMLARVLGSWREAPKTIWDLWKPILVVLVPMGLVMLQPDLGSALVFASILLASLFWAGTPLLTLFLLVTPVISLFVSISVWVWGAYLALLTGGLVWLFLNRKTLLSEAVVVWLLNAAAGAAALEQPQAVPKEPLHGVSRPLGRSAGRRVQPDPVTGGHREWWMVGERMAGRYAKAARLPA